MTITPRWKNEEPGNTPTGLPSAGHAQNLSDLDVTQPSLRVSQSDRVHPGAAPVSINAPGNDAINHTIASTRSHGGSDDPLVGTVFAERYEVLELLGRGGMGSVYKVRNQLNKSLRALKLMHAHLVADPQVFRRFQQEATAAARINHPNAISIIDMGMAADGRPYLIMDFLDGMSLSELLKYKRKLPIRESLHIFTQMCGALAEAHGHGVIHRDIKPSNVMLLDAETGPEYVVKVVDFGIAKVFPQEGDPTMKDTTTGELFGSPPYMSPEQCLGKRLDYRSDIYSMGCLMYEVLTGAPPLVGQNALGTMYRQINDMPTPLSDIKDDVRLIQRLDEIIIRCLQKLPENRYQSILELHQDLESAGALSSKRSKALSAVGLKLQAVKRAILNGMGSSKKVVVVFLVACLMVLWMGGLFLVPYVVTKDPGPAERAIAWQDLLAETHGSSSNTKLVFEDRINEARMLHGKNSEEHFQARSKFADSLFNDGINDKALSQYMLACAIGEVLMKDNFSKCAHPQAALDMFVKDQLRLAPLLFGVSQANLKKMYEHVANMEELVPPSETVLLAQSTLRKMKESGLGRDENRAYLQAILGLSLLHGSAANSSSTFTSTSTFTSSASADDKARVATNQPFEEALSAWEKVNVSSEQGEAFAAVLSQIGDYYLSLHDHDSLLLANRAFELARKSWLVAGAQNSKSTVARDLNNAAVAEDRLGRVQQLLGHNKEAAEYFGKAADDFKAGNKSDTMDRAKDLFNQADAQWTAGEFLKSLQTHKEATKLWSATKTN
jgi:tetratricopeptide (TPR) repeat protein